MQDLDAGGRELTGEIQALHSRITKLEQVSHNLPGHKNVDEELDNAWREWETTFDAIKDSLILTDSEFTIIQANLAASRLFDRPLDQIAGRTCWQLVHGTNETPEGCPLKRAKTTKKHEEIELYLPQKGIWVTDSVDPVLDQQGGLTGAVHTIRDITDRKRAEELLRRERDRAQQYLDVAGVMFLAIDAEQRVGLINKKGCEILGYNEEEIIAKNWFDNFLPEKNREEVRAVFEKLLRGEVGALEYYENPILTKNGDQRLIAWHNTVLRDDKGQVIAALGSGEDITERKKAEESLITQHEELQTIFDSVPASIFYKDKTNRMVRVNNAAVEHIGQPKEQIEGRSCYELFPNQAEAYFRNDNEVMTTGRPKKNMIEPIENSSETRWVQTDKVPYKDKDGNIVGVIGFAIDVTECKKAEQKLLEDQAKLKSLASQLTLAEERERRHLATELHDRISQALVISKIKLDALRKSGRSRKLDKALEDVCNCLGQTIQDTRTLTFDLGNPVLYELGFETAVSEWLTEQIQKKHGLSVEFEDDREPKPLDEDVRILLFRDVRELLINVVKHAGAHKVKVSLRKLDNICVTVEDDGVGFDPVEVLAGAAKRGGFGLFSIRERLENLGGHLQIDSAPGRGCKVTMTAPLKQKEMTR
jgi:PAS domain S-box-containing protein